MKKLHNFLILILIGILLITYSVFFISKDEDLHVYFFDVGQGDASLIAAPSDFQVLVDGGPNNRVFDHLGKVIPFYDRKIDLVILTHPHADHLTGFIKVIQNYEIGQVWINGVSEESREDEEFQKLIVEKKLNVIEPQIGQYLRQGDLKLSVVSPFTKDPSGNPNEDSLIIKMEYKNKSIFFSGDSELEEQEELAESGINLKSDILKQPHHGSEKFSQNFLAAISPQYVVVSCGKNNIYGFPNLNTLEKLKDKKIFRTDEQGSIQALITGKGSLEFHQ